MESGNQTSETVEPAKPTYEGVHRNMPAEVYHSIRYASASYLKEIARSPSHCLASMTGRKAPTPEMLFGTAVHTATLEPALFPQQYAVASQCAQKTDGGKGSQCKNTGKLRDHEGRWFCGQHLKGIDFPAQNFTGMPMEDYDRARYIADSVRSHPAAREILEKATDIELSAFWEDGASGVRQKMRTDLLLENDLIVADLKTSGDASYDGFERSLWDYRYDLSAANYMRGLAITMGKSFTKFQFIVVEKTPPFAVAVYELDNNDVLKAMEELDLLLEIWRKCEESPAEWTRGYSTKLEKIGLGKFQRQRRDIAIEAMQAA